METNKKLQFHEFLGSDAVELYTTSSSESWKIHRRLLEWKCKSLQSAFTPRFSEGTSGQYTFTETTHDTVARFVEWAYTGDFAEADLTPTNVTISEESQPKPDGYQSADEKKSIKAHTFLCHLRVYIFSDTYLIPDLKQLTFEKFTAAVINMEKPKNLDQQLAIIDCLSLAFLKLPDHDPLILWLAQYAAWSLDNLRLQNGFHDLLKEFPALSYRMMNSLIPANEAPWNAKSPKFKVPIYNSRTPCGDNEY